MIIFLRIIIPSFQSHQTRTLSEGLGMAWNRYGLSWTYIWCSWGSPGGWITFFFAKDDCFINGYDILFFFIWKKKEKKTSYRSYKNMRPFKNVPIIWLLKSCVGLACSTFWILLTHLKRSHCWDHEKISKFFIWKNMNNYRHFDCSTFLQSKGHILRFS